MMTFSLSRWRDGGGGGFTFFEIAIALALIAIIFLGTVPFITASLQEREMRGYVDSVVELARTERAEAELTGVERRVWIGKNGFERLEAEQPRPVVVLPEPERGKLLVRYPGGKWAAPDGQEWRFFSAGMVTPLSVRLEDGEAWIEVDFDFLTGRVAEERYAF